MTTDYGTDLSCTNDLTSTCATASGVTVVGQALYRRLITPRGRLLSDPKYGTDIRQWLNEDVAPANLAALQGAIQAECLKDERVLGADVTIAAPARLTGAYIITIVVTLQQNVTFDLVLSVTGVTVSLLQVNP